MRRGSNPAKANAQLEVRAYHRVIVPVYLPSLEGYFAEGVEVLRVCLDTLVATLHPRACVTLVDNGCCPEAREVLEAYYRAGHVQQLVHLHENVGKVDAVLGVARGCYEPLITVTDADVLFEPGWIEAVEGVFEAAPEAGLVSPCPIPAAWRYQNTATLLQGLLTGRGGYAPYVTAGELQRFPDSIGSETLYRGKEALFDRQMTLRLRTGQTVLVGCGHFVATLRREAFRAAPDRPALRTIANGSEREYLDRPVDRAGMLRLATDRVYAHHMGNALEPWMLETAARACAAPPAQARASVAPPRPSVGGRVPYAVRTLFARSLGAAPFRRVFLALWGVPRGTSFT